MSVSMDQTAFAAALKQMYKEPTIANLVYKNNPAYALLKKSEDFYGEVEKYPVLYSNPQGASATFSSALANKQASALQAFLLSRVSDYATANIAGETIEASRNNAGAFMSALKTEMDGAFQIFGLRNGSALYRSGTGSIGQISATSTVASVTITLSNPADVVNFFVNQTLQAAATDGGAPRSGTVVVTGVNRANGQLTAAANWSAGITGLTAGDFLLVNGDSNLKISGFAGWLPMASTVSSTPFFGVDRSIDKQFLAGVFTDATGAPIEEAIIQSASDISTNGGMPDVCFMNPLRYADLIKSMGAKVQYGEIKTPDGYFAFTGVKMHGPNGEINIVSDRNCQSDRAYVMTWEDWSLRSLNKAPHILGLDGLDFLRQGTADGYEIRVGGYMQVKCIAPGRSGVVKLK
jgi:hypothetical protein